MLEVLRAGGKRAIAQALAQIESSPDTPDTAGLLDQAFANPKGTALGLTGPPGVGKSTLIDAIIRGWRAQGLTVAVIAVDPSSSRTGGALLGDRTRFSVDPGDAGIFVRSMAARNRLGGVADLTFPATVLLRALFDRVIVETVGVGQSETAISETADLVAFCAQPGSGDALQFMKAGIMEVPDLVIVTKADLGALATRTASDLKGALSLTTGTEVPVVLCSATSGTGLEDLLREICKRSSEQTQRFGRSRKEQAETWARQQILDAYGREGLKLAHRFPVDNSNFGHFRRTIEEKSRLADAMRAAFH